MHNNVPGGKNVGEFLPSGVERAGGARVEGLIEQLRERIRVLEQVPVSLPPPAPDAGLSPPRLLPSFSCSFIAVAFPAGAYKLKSLPLQGGGWRWPSAIAGGVMRRQRLGLRV